MKVIKENWGKFKKTKIYVWYKELPIALVGVTAFLAIILFLTIIFNWFWTGLGDDPTHYYFPSITKVEQEFKDYATLYIALLSFGATLFAGLAVFLVFNDWKEQHNQSVDSKYYEKALDSFKSLSSTVRNFKVLYDEIRYINISHNADATFFKDKYTVVKNELVKNLDQFQGELVFLQHLNFKEKETIEKIFNNYINKARNELEIQDISLKYYNSSESHLDIQNDLYNISSKQGKLVSENIESIVDYLNSKIKA